VFSLIFKVFLFIKENMALLQRNISRLGNVLRTEKSVYIKATWFVAEGVCEGGRARAPLPENFFE